MLEAAWPSMCSSVATLRKLPKLPDDVELFLDIARGWGGWVYVLWCEGVVDGKELIKVGMSEAGTSRLGSYVGGNKIKKVVVWARVKKAIESERFFISWFGDRFDVLSEG